MNLLDYISGNKKGRNAHRLEKEAMQNPFLREALEGFENIEDNHPAKIEELYSIINEKSIYKEKSTKPFPFHKLVAACIVLIISSVIFLVSDTPNGALQASTTQSSGLIEIYVPSDFYRENIAVIAQNNTQQVKRHRPLINVDNLKAGFEKAQQSDDIETNNETNPIEIYLPQ